MRSSIAATSLCPLTVIDEYPVKLSQTGERHWRLHAEFSLDHARMRAERGDIIGTALLKPA